MIYRLLRIGLVLIPLTILIHNAMDIKHTIDLYDKTTKLFT